VPGGTTCNEQSVRFSFQTLPVLPTGTNCQGERAAARVRLLEDLANKMTTCARLGGLQSTKTGHAEYYTSHIVAKSRKNRSDCPTWTGQGSEYPEHQSAHRQAKSSWVVQGLSYELLEDSSAADSSPAMQITGLQSVCRQPVRGYKLCLTSQRFSVRRRTS